MPDFKTVINFRENEVVLERAMHTESTATPSEPLGV